MKRKRTSMKKVIAHQDLIYDLYVRQKLSPKLVSLEIEKITGENLSPRTIIHFLGKMKWQRNPLEAFRCKRFKIHNCKICKTDYTPTSANQKTCKICIPDQAAAGRYDAFGIVQADYERMLTEQQNRCPICDVEFSTLSSNMIHVDHDHETGKVRGILCGKCNPKLLSREWHQRALKYLDETR